MTPWGDPLLIRLRLVLYYVAVFVVLGAWIPYWPVWLEDRGCSKTEIGVLLSAAIWARVVATPWFASIADRSGRRRATIALLSWLAAASVAPFPWADGFFALLALCVLFGITYPPLIPLSDGLTVLQARRTPGLRYGRIRLWGSLAFLLTALGLGAALESSPPGVVHVTIVTALVAAGILAFALPDPRPDTDPGAGHGGRPVRTLLRDPTFRLVLASTGLIQASHAAYYAFATVHWRAAGIHEATIGFLWAEGVIAEIALFAFGAAWAERLGPVKLFALGAGAATVRWTAFAASTDVAVLVLTNWLHAFSFGATHLAAIGHVTRAVPQSSAATAQSLLAAISTGAGMALATLCAGAIYEAAPAMAFAAMIALAAAGAGCAYGLSRRRSLASL